ncbi:MAG: hypothetical protein IJ225_05345 [Solobacterium sp.]|nr:hypothetical protein [Solobacterium sp.]
MAENKPSGRPTGRPQSDAKSSGKVRKRGEGLGTGSVGNVDYDERKAASSNNKPASGNGNRAGGNGNRASGNSPLNGIGGLGGYNTGSSSSNHINQGTQVPFGVTGGHSSGNIPSGNNNNRRNSGGLLRIILLVLILLFVMNMLGMCGTSSTGTSSGFTESTPATTTTTTTNTTASSASVGGTWNPVSTTYENTNQSAVSTSVASGAREKFTTLKGNGNDQVTVLVYMCGTDLESNYGMATSDLNEMVYATHSSKVNVVVETGGTKQWKNSVIASNTNQRWLISDRAVVPLDKNLGKKAMTDPQTLTDFIQWGAANYPADRYFLILWDHGGGSLSGYAHDELYPNGTMTVDEIASALKNSGIKFDVVGFDACLMANMETAIAVEPYADYLIASEETEPGTGWYYTDWLTMLAQNSSTPTTTVGKQIIDDFITASYQSSSRDKTSLSLIDLAEFSGTVPAIFSEFAKDITSDIKGDNFQKVATARSNTKEFATSTKIDQIDLIHFCKNLGTTSANALANSIQSCVKYNRCNNMNNAYGMSIYFPYYSPRNVNSAVQVYSNLGMNSDYTDAIRSFATMSASGQIVSNSNSNSLFDILGGGSSYSSSSSYDSSDILNLLLGGGSSSYSSGYGSSGYTNSGYGSSGSYGSGYSGGGYSLYDMLGGSSAVDSNSLDLFSLLIGRSHVDTSNLILTENDAGQSVLSLSQSEWDLITDVNLNVWVDDGEGYIDLGIDEVYSFDDDGALIVDYSGTWTGINGQVVSYYSTGSEYISDSEYTYNGYIPVLYNGERANILIEYNPEHPDGEVLGILKIYEDGMEAKGYLQPEAGDTIDFLCDYYDYDGTYLDTYYLGDQLIVSEDLEVEAIALEDVKAIFGYRLTDIYNANVWTPMLEYNN